MSQQRVHFLHIKKRRQIHLTQQLLRIGAAVLDEIEHACVVPEKRTVNKAIIMANGAKSLTKEAA